MIESIQNDKVKYITRLLTDNRFRKKEGVFVIEGKQENQRAIYFGYSVKEYFICNSIYKGEALDAKTHFVSEKVYEKIAYRGTSEGIIGIYEVQEHLLETFQPQENSSVIVVESLEKPGNLGAILRSCEAFGIDALIITDAKVDFYNPNVIRSSVGCLFGMNIFKTTNQELLKFLIDHKYQLCTTFMGSTAISLAEIDLNRNSAILFGTEHSGLSEYWSGRGQNTLIPMAGTIDSLNLSNAVAIACYETLRQKRQ